jgi:lipopolysaccharide biosynthesis protein
VLPFLKIIHLVVEQGFSYFLKIHTKKSTHREDGDVWRNDLYTKLLGPEKLTEMVKISDADHRIGLIGPRGHLVSMTTYLGSNRNRIKWYAERMGLSMDEVLEIPFVAGNMFFARVSSVFPLLCLGMDDMDFEPEKGQVDGTLAHSIERLFSISTVAAGMKIVDTYYVDDPASAIHVNDNYGFV